MIDTLNAASSNRLPDLNRWQDALRQGDLWGNADVARETLAAISGGFGELPAALNEQGSAYTDLVYQQVRSLEAGMIALIQTLMLVDAEQSQRRD